MQVARNAKNWNTSRSDSAEIWHHKKHGLKSKTDNLLVGNDLSLVLQMHLSDQQENSLTTERNLFLNAPSRKQVFILTLLEDFNPSYYVKWKLTSYLKNWKTVTENINQINNIIPGCNLFCHPVISSNHLLASHVVGILYLNKRNKYPLTFQLSAVALRAVRLLHCQTVKQIVKTLCHYFLGFSLFWEFRGHKGWIFQAVLIALRFLSLKCNLSSFTQKVFCNLFSTSTVTHWDYKKKEMTDSVWLLKKRKIHPTLVFFIKCFLWKWRA